MVALQKAQDFAARTGIRCEVDARLSDDAPLERSRRQREGARAGHDGPNRGGGDEDGVRVGTVGEERGADAASRMHPAASAAISTTPKRASTRAC